MTKAQSYVLPTCHINGTSRQLLLDGYTEAYRKLIEFRDAFNSIEHNARDYYVQGPDAYYKARDQRDAERQRIADLMRYLEDHLLHLGA